MVEKGGSREQGTKGSETLEERGRRRQEESAGKGSVQGARGAAGAENTPGAGIGLRCLPSLLLGPPSACFSPPSSLMRAQFAAQSQGWMETWELSQWRS